MMKVNSQSISSYRCLPPNVEGELSGALTMQVDEILWCKKVTTDVIVCVQWWGEQEPMKFRPLRGKNSTDSGVPVVFTYRIYTSPQLFYSYLEDSKKLNLVVVNKSIDCPVGLATLCNLREAFTEQAGNQLCLPIVDLSGVKVAELYLSLTLKFFENIRIRKTFLPESSSQTTRCAAQQTVSIPTRGVPDSLVVQLLQQAQRLRDAMARSVLQDWEEETDIHQSHTECSHTRMFQDEKLLSHLLDVDDDVAQQEAVEALNEICPTSELLNLVAPHSVSTRDAELGSKEQEMCELPANGKRQPKEIAEGSLLNSVTHDEQRQIVSGSVSEFLEMVVSMRVCVNSLHLQNVPRSNGTYFVDYEVPQCLLSGHTPLSRTTCSRRLAGRVVQFGQRFVHILSKKGTALGDLLRDTCLLFSVYCRQLSERKRSLMGQATMSLVGLAEAEHLEVQQELVVRGVGKLRVMVQLGCDKVQFGRQLLVKEKEGKQFSQSGWITSADNPPLSTAVEKPCLPSDLEQGSQPSTITAPLQDPHSSNQLLYTLLHVPWGRLTTPSNSYLVCRAFWKDHILTSDVARGECNPHFNLYQVLPLLLSPELLERCRDNVLVLEVWEWMRGACPDSLLGLAKVSLHPFYLVYKDPIVVSQQLLAKYPVVSADKWVQVICPSTGTVRGELKVLLALGTENQVLSLGSTSTSGSIVGPAGDNSRSPQVLQEASRDVPLLQTVEGTTGGTVTGSRHILQAFQSGTRSDKFNKSVLQNTIHANDIPPVQSNKVEFLTSHVTSGANRLKQNDVNESVNFVTSCRNESWKQKNEGSNKSKRLYSCECIHKGRVPSAQVNVRGTFEKLAGGYSNVDTFVDNVPVLQDIVSDHERLRTKRTLRNYDTSAIDSSGCSSDPAKSVDSEQKVELPITNAACSLIRQDICSSSGRHRGDGSAILSELQRNLMQLNLAGGDNWQLESVTAARHQSCVPDSVVEYECELEVKTNEKMNENTAADHTSLNYFSPGHSSITRFTNVESSCNFSEVGCRDSVDVGCNTESKHVYENGSILLPDSPSMDKAEESSESFSARVQVEQAMHLKFKVPWCISDDRKVYVTFQANDRGLQPLSSPAVKASKDPVWDWYCDTQLALCLVNSEEKRLVLKVWQMAGGDVNAAADTVLGFAVIDLTSLLQGFAYVSGWYNLVDYSGCCVGQIKVTVMPLEDMSRFVNCTPEMEVPIQESHNHLESDLYTNLNEKLSELDEITTRLRRRLDTVVSDERILHAPPTDASTQVIRLESSTAFVAHEERVLEDKCIQTSICDEDSDAWTDWLMGMTMRDLELENVFNPLLFQPLISSCMEQSRLQQVAEPCHKQSATTEVAEPRTAANQVVIHSSISRPQTVAERLQTLWNNSNDLGCIALRQAPDGVSICENSTSVSQLSILEDMKKSSKT